MDGRAAGLDSDRSLSWDLCVGWPTKVAWLEEPDVRLTRESASRRDSDFDSVEARDLGRSRRLPPLVSSSRLFLSAERSVSGGEGGGEAFLEDEDLRPAPVVFDLCPSSFPTSVGSGVGGSVRFLPETFSLLDTASLLWALLNDGYGRDTRSRSNVETPLRRSLAENRLSLDSGSVLSFSLVRCFLTDVDCVSLASLHLPRADLEERCGRCSRSSFGLRSDFERRCFSAGRFSTSASASFSVGVIVAHSMGHAEHARGKRAVVV